MAWAVGALGVLSAGVGAQDGGLAVEERLAVVADIGARLERSYVFPEMAEKCAAHLLRQLEAGAFSELDDPEGFAAALTAELQAVSGDKHLLVRVRQPERVDLEEADPVSARLQRLARMRAENFGFPKVELLEGNVGYVDTRGFQPPDLARDTVTSVMGFLSHADAIIIDVRENGGGIPETVQLVCSYFFDERTHLNSLYFREGDRTIEYWTLDDVAGKKMPDVPLFVLTGTSTFSAAEEFSYNLRTQERATLIGATTRGGANPGSLQWIDDQFEIFVPTGRAINPVTQTNWEGTGVEPHVVVAEEEALEVALVEARKAAEVWRGTRRDALKIWSEVREAARGAEASFEKGRNEEATATVHGALRAALDLGVLDERDINLWGYEYLQTDGVEMAIAILGFNAEEFPESANVWDSLGEAYMLDGQADLAVHYYEKSLELDPDNGNARQILEQVARTRRGD